MHRWWQWQQAWLPLEASVVGHLAAIPILPGPDYSGQRHASGASCVPILSILSLSPAVLREPRVRQ
jgi:hypothetical protein